jgi:hypothetical protein
MKLTTKLMIMTAAVVGAGLSAQATVIDATTIGGTGTTASGAIFTGIDPQSTGTGVIDPFLREQANTSEQGLNTSAGTPFDDKGGPWTHDLAVSSLSSVTVAGKHYYQFYLDANQVGNGNVSLVNFQIFVTSGAPATTAAQLAAIVAGTPAFDMNDATHTYRVDVAGNNGSGSGDMTVLVPTSAIGTTGNLYLFAGFGKDAAGGGFETNDGFEEWNAVEGPNFTIPDASSTLSLLGLGLLGVEALRRRLKS